MGKSKNHYERLSFECYRWRISKWGHLVADFDDWLCAIYYLVLTSFFSLWPCIDVATK